MRSLSDKGFVTSIDTVSCQIRVNDDAWDGLSVDRKHSMISLGSRYMQSHVNRYDVKILGSRNYKFEENSMSTATLEKPARLPLASEQINSHCTLCGQEKKKLILGRHGGICLDCVGLCNEIIQQGENV